MQSDPSVPLSLSVVPAPAGTPCVPLPESVERLSNDALEDELTLLAGLSTSASHRMLTLLREIDRREAVVAYGFCTTAHWLAFNTSMSMNTAREKVRVARALGELPLIDDAFRRAKVSYSQVRAITRVATPEIESELMPVLLYGTAHHAETFVKRFSRGLKGLDAEHALSQLESRSLELRWDDDGMLLVNGRFTPDDGALLLQAIEATQFPPRPQLRARAEAARAQGGDGALTDPRTFTQKRADAWVELVRRAVHDAVPGAPVAEVASDMPDAPVTEERTHDVSAEVSGSAARGRPTVTLHVNADALMAAGENPMASIAGGPGIAAEVARRLACDANIVALVENARGDPLALGRKHRTVPPPLRRALESRDRGCCRFPGCTRTRYLDAHHIRHWAAGGETDIENLVLLCPHHHRFVHEGGYRIERDSERGGFVFTPPEGTALHELPEAKPLPPDYWKQLAVWVEGQVDLEIDCRTAIAGWNGERWRPNDFIDALLERVGKEVPNQCCH